MRQKLSKATACCAALLLAASFVGCQPQSSDPTAGSSAAPSASTQAGASTDPQPSAAGSDASVDCAPAGQFPITAQPTTLSVYATVADDISIEDNEVLKQFQDKTNIKLDIKKETDKEQKVLMLSSGDYPEIFLSSFSMLDVANYGPKQGLFIKLDDLIDQYSVEVKNRLANDEHYRISAQSTDGSIYGLPRMREEVFAHVVAPAKYWINTAWLDKLGLSKPTTTEEFKQVMLAFKNGDPNGNGKADEIPISGAIKTANGEPQWFLLNAFCYVGDGYLAIENGKMSFVANSDAYKEGLTYMRDLYREGLIDPASFTQDLAQLTQLGTNEPAILGSFGAMHPAMAIDIADVELSRQYDVLLPLKGPQGVQYAQYAGQDGYYSSINVAITDACKNPAAAMRAVDYLYSDELQMAALGPEGEKWDWVDDPNVKDMYGQPARYKAYTNYVSDALRNEKKLDEFPSLPLSATLWGRQEADVDGDIYDPANYEVRLAQATLDYKPYFPKENIVPYKFDQATSEELATLSVNIKNYVAQSTTRFITEDMSLENDWQTYLDGLKNLNVDRYVEVYQKGYDDLKAMQ